MVEPLIKNVRAAEQCVIAYWQKLKPHYAGHEEAPLWMACLAAFPVAVNIDLLYQLWANFRELKDTNGKTYQLPPLVVNDCILSPLFRITGKEMYEMASDTRAFLLSVLKENFGEHLIEDLASFLYKYIQEKKTTAFPKNFYDAQEWTALLAVAPRLAAMNILTSLRSTLEKDRLQSIGVTNLLTTLVKENHELADMLRKAIDIKQEYEDIKADDIVAEAADDIPNKNIMIMPAAAGTGITIDVPAAFTNTLMPLYEAGVAETYRQNDSTNKGVVYAVMVIGTTSLHQMHLAFADALRNKNLVKEQNIHLFFASAATYAAVMDTLRRVLSQANADDTVLFCFQGQSFKEDKTIHLVLTDSSEEGAHETIRYNAATQTLTNDAFSELVRQHAIKRPAIIIILDSHKCTPFDWLPNNYTNQVTIAPDDNVKASSELPPGLIAMLARKIAASKQNLTYKEIIAHLVTIEKHWPRIIIQPEWLDNYFLTPIKQSPTLQIQQLLSALGYSLFVDGKPGSQYRKVLQDFTTRYGLTPDEDVLKELQNAVLLKNGSLIQIFYISPDSVSVPNEIREQQDRLKQAFKREIETTNKVTVKTIEDFENDVDDKLYERLLHEIHVILIGVDSSWIEETNKRKDFYAGLIILLSLNKNVYFVIEEECNWRSLPFINNRVLPLTLQPVNQEDGMQELIRNVAAILEKMQKYLLPENPAADGSVIEQRIREARKTKELDLSGLSLQEIPPAVFQMEGLISLDLSNNNIAVLPENVGKLNKLRKLNLSRNPIESLPENVILFLLEELDLRETRIERLPGTIGELSNLKRLRIDFTRIKVLPVGFFVNGLPRELTWDGLELLNVNTSVNPASLAAYFAPFHTKEFAILEIHSESAIPRFDTVPAAVREKVHYHFLSQVDTLRELFEVIYTEAGDKHTIVYLCDEKNILSPQFGIDAERHDLIHQYWEAFGKPLNLMINNPHMQSAAYIDLTDKGALNFVAVRNDRSVNDETFPDLFFRTIWHTPEIDQIHRIFLVTASPAANNMERYLWEEIQKEGYPSWSHREYTANITNADLVIFIINEITFFGGRPMPSLEEQYNLALQRKKRILVFINEQMTASRILINFIKGPIEGQIIYDYSDEQDILDKIQRYITHIKRIEKHGKRMSLANTLKYIEQEITKKDLEPGYDLFINYGKLNDFSFPVNRQRSVMTAAPKTADNPKPKKDSFKATVKRLYESRQIKVPDDLQKGRWGGKATNNGKRLQARVEPLKDSPGLYSIFVTISGKPLSGQVALFLHNSFSDEIEYGTAVNDQVTFDLVAYEAFTMGAYAEDGTTLELDLNTVKGYPAAFYYHDPTPSFKKMVENLYNSNPVKDKSDLQKDRWGGKKTDEGLTMHATVNKTFSPGWFNIHITVTAEDKCPFDGEVAFFIHDSFPNEIRYTAVKNGQASLHVLAYEAFTIGAYTDEGVFLELDLQEQEGYPSGFYYEQKVRKPKAKARLPLKASASKKKTMLKKFMRKK
ncbi:leucine-rich repeat domain-containing protein [Longitalea luteola]|uniref:leucine-rich repeat domain-containing protein n=1 Tax=Longitalea luteola TaxID=2812563 RepID=UPI001A977BAF|nr:leucine-rich repeat domain-containing protein [Longitalea luteola]